MATLLKYCSKGKCETRPMIGRSWWKMVGYNIDCICAYTASKKIYGKDYYKYDYEPDPNYGKEVEEKWDEITEEDEKNAKCEGCGEIGKANHNFWLKMDKKEDPRICFGLCGVCDPPEEEEEELEYCDSCESWKKHDDCDLRCGCDDL